MHDGEIVECSGQWWDGMNGTHRMLMEGIELVHISANGLEALQNCYVYYGYAADKEKYEAIRATYTGPVYEYYDGEFIIKSWLKNHGKWKNRIISYNGEMELVDEHNDLYQYKTIQGKMYFRFLWNIEECRHGLYKEYLTEGKLDFRKYEPKVKRLPAHCQRCGSERVLTSDSEDAVCYQCEKEIDYKDQRSNYYY